MMYLRTAPEETLSSLLDTMGTTPVSTMTLAPHEIHLDVVAGTLDLNGTEVRLRADGIKSLADDLEVPSAFLLRQDLDFQQVVLNTLLERKAKPSTYAIADGALVEVRNPNVTVIEPPRLLAAAARVIDPLAPVRDFWADASEFRLDIYVPENFERGLGGDVNVGDVSAAGIRITQDRKHNLAPSVQPFQYRYFCTNGMSSRHDQFKVDARGQSVEEVLAQFETMANLAFTAAEREIETLYSLRTERVANPERTMLRMARDAGLPDRTVTTLLERVAGIDEDQANEGFVSTFDLINLMTNEANNPSVRRTGYRTALEGAAGGIVTEHAARCTHCQSRLTH